MNIELPPDLEKSVQEKVTGGQYNSTTELIHEALYLLLEHDQLQQSRMTSIRKKIADGLEQANQGDLHDGDVFLTSLEESM